MRVLAASSSPPPLVGRDRELRALRARLADTLAGRGGLVLISGEAGIGKSALVDRLGQEAAAAGARFAGGSCYDRAETPPHGPWAGVFARLGAAPSSPMPPNITTAPSHEILFA